MNEVEKHASANISRILVGNKSDLEENRQVSTDEGKELAEHYNIKFLETSAKDCKNVEEAFITMARELQSRVVITKPKRPTSEGTGQKISKGSHQTKKLQKKEGCCA